MGPGRYSTELIVASVQRSLVITCNIKLHNPKLHWTTEYTFTITHGCIYVCTYIHIYIERERECVGEREGERHVRLLPLYVCVCVYMYVCVYTYILICMYMYIRVQSTSSISNNHSFFYISGLIASSVRQVNSRPWM